MNPARVLALAALLVAAVAALAGTRITSDASVLLPNDPALTATLEAARRTAGARALLFAVEPPEDPTRLRDEIHALAEALRALPAIAEVRTGVTTAELEAMGARLGPHTTAFVPADQLAARTSEAGVREALANQASRLSGWGGFLFAASAADDPLDLRPLASGALASDLPGAYLSEGLLRTEGGEALLVAETTREPGAVMPGDPDVAAIEGVLASSGLRVRWFGGLRLAAGTADTVRADVTRTSVVGALLLAAVMALGLRSWRPVAGALGPLGVAAAASTLGAWWASPLHGLQLGFGAALAGLAVDYWIHVYLAASARGGDPREDGEAAVAELSTGLWVSAGSSALAFLVLTRSDLPVVRTLGWTGAAATLGALLGVRLLGPAMYAWVGRSRGDTPWPVLPGAAAVGIGAVLLGFVGMDGTFDADPMALVARPAHVRADEAWFADHHLLGRERGLALFRGPDAHDRAADAQAALHDLHLGPVHGPGSVLPSPAQTARRRAALPPVDVLQARIDAAAAEVGIGPYPGAAQRVHDRAADVPLDLWEGTANAGRSLLGADDALVVVPLADATVVPTFADTLAAVDDVPFVVPSQRARDSLDRARSDLVRFGAFGGLVVLVVLIVRHGRVDRALFALLPAAAALAGSAGVMVLAGVPWNAVSLATLVPVLGLAVDYGVFLAEGHPSAPRAVALSAGTTLAGFLPLALAESPALAGVGLAMGAGVGTAGLVAVVLLPALQRGWPGERTRVWVERLALAAVLAVHLDVGWIALASFTPPLPERQLPREVVVEGDTRSSGPVRLVRTEGIHVLATEGEPYEMGWRARRVTSHLRPRLEEELFDSFTRNVPTPVFRWLITRGSLAAGWSLEEHLLPAHRAEIQGGDDASDDPYWLAGPSYTRKVYYHALHDIGQALVDSPLLACTGFLAGPGATADGHWLLARNFDFEGGVAFDRDKIVRVHRSPDGHSYASVGFAGMIGAVSGVNDAGIAIAINASGSSVPPRPGTPMTLILREVLESAGSLDDVERILRERTGFVSENVLVVDADHGRAALFEVTPAQVERIDVTGSLGVSNHFRSGALLDDPTNRHRMATSTTVQRLARMNELLRTHHGALDTDVALRVLGDRASEGGEPLPDGHRHALDAMIATHAVVIDATTRTLRVSRFPNLSAGFVELRLDDLLAGELHARSVGSVAGDAPTALAMREGRELLRAARRSGAARADSLTARALISMGDHPEAHFERGRVLAERGELDEAREHLRRALELVPEYAHQREQIEAWLR
ncbi:MAG: tetratricopeptide repeat protein [Alphaproteobacteria bacterium]|nr:tetratricopeptide repeat protein [Alphaproteobacteria bacterium]